MLGTKIFQECDISGQRWLSLLVQPEKFSLPWENNTYGVPDDGEVDVMIFVAEEIALLL